MRMLSAVGYIFLGQSVGYKGNAIYNTLPENGERIEFPVAEDFQLGASIGLAMQGEKVLSIFPRMDFLICAMNQLVNHLDKISEMSAGIWKPKVIIRTMIGSKEPLDAGPQHTGDYSAMLRYGLKNISIYNLGDATAVLPCYKLAMRKPESAILIERGDCY